MQWDRQRNMEKRQNAEQAIFTAVSHIHLPSVVDEERKEQIWSRIEAEMNQMGSKKHKSSAVFRSVLQLFSSSTRTGIVVVLGLCIVIYAMAKIFSATSLRTTATNVSYQTAPQQHAGNGEMVTNLIPPNINPGNTLTGAPATAFTSSI